MKTIFCSRCSPLRSFCLWRILGAPFILEKGVAGLLGLQPLARTFSRRQVRRSLSQPPLRRLSPAKRCPPARCPHSLRRRQCPCQYPCTLGLPPRPTTARRSMPIFRTGADTSRNCIRAASRACRRTRNRTPSKCLSPGQISLTATSSVCPSTRSATARHPTHRTRRTHRRTRRPDR